jgi:hypothetical protein
MKPITAHTTRRTGGRLDRAQGGRDDERVEGGHQRADRQAGVPLARFPRSKPTAEADTRNTIEEDPMRQVMVRYKVKPDRVKENEELVRAVYRELRHTEPAGLRYATFKLDDGVSFVHLAVSEGDAGGPLSEVKAFQEFQRNIEDRTDEAPVVTGIEEIGSYRLVGDSRGD